MKNKMRYLSILSLLIILCILSGCQDEVLQITEPPAAQVIKPNSTAAALIKRTTLKDGSVDNILDSASCISVVLPVTVLVNEQEITITSYDGLKLVERILDEFENDDDEVTLIFPITVSLADHSELIVENEEALGNLTEQCIEGGNDDDIECVDFKYPVTLSIYDTDNQLSDVITLHDDDELYNFFDEMEEGDLVGFQFPVTMILSDGQEITANDNEELEGTIENVINDCDEDDDNDYNDDDADDSDLIIALIDGEWKVALFFRESDQTGNFENFIFTFYADGTALASNGVSSFEGTWESYGDDGALEIELDFGVESPFDSLQKDWQVTEYTNTGIKLEKEEDGGEPAMTLIFERP